MIARNNVTLSTVRDYLASLPDDGLAGEAHSPYACPVAQAVTWHGYTAVCVTVNRRDLCAEITHAHGNDDALGADRAVARLIDAVDAEAASGEWLTAAQVRELIERVA
jgi:hypothetical protein